MNTVPSSPTVNAVPQSFSVGALEMVVFQSTNGVIARLMLYWTDPASGRRVLLGSSATYDLENCVEQAVSAMHRAAENGRLPVQKRRTRTARYDQDNRMEAPAFRPDASRATKDS